MLGITRYKKKTRYKRKKIHRRPEQEIRLRMRVLNKTHETTRNSKHILIVNKSHVASPTCIAKSNQVKSSHESFHLQVQLKGIWQYIFILAYRQEPLK